MLLCLNLARADSSDLNSLSFAKLTRLALKICNYLWIDNHLPFRVSANWKLQQYLTAFILFFRWQYCLPMTDTL